LSLPKRRDVLFTWPSKWEGKPISAKKKKAITPNRAAKKKGEKRKGTGCGRHRRERANFQGGRKKKQPKK